MWEVFTEGRMPFEQNQNHEVVTLVTMGHRLYRPKMATPTIYDIMQLCWHQVRNNVCSSGKAAALPVYKLTSCLCSQRPDERPSFSQLCLKISEALEGDTPSPDPVTNQPLPP